MAAAARIMERHARVCRTRFVPRIFAYVARVTMPAMENVLPVSKLGFPQFNSSINEIN